MDKFSGNLAEYAFWHDLSDDDKRILHQVCRYGCFDVSPDFDKWLDSQAQWLEDYEKHGEQTRIVYGDFLPDRMWLETVSLDFEILAAFGSYDEYERFLKSLLDNRATIAEVNARTLLIIGRKASKQDFPHSKIIPRFTRQYEIIKHI